MVRLLHLADVHLGAPLGAFGAQAAARRQAVLDAFCHLTEIAAAEQVDAVVIAGDLFDGARPAPELAAKVRETFRGLDEAGIPVLLVPGNHDAITLRPNPYQDGFGKVHVFRSSRFDAPVTLETENGPLNVYAFAFDRARDPDPLSSFTRSSLPGVHVAVLHGSVPDAPHWDTSPNALRLPHDDLARLQVDYIALGDYHRFRRPAEFAADGSIPACYAGSFAAVDLTESGPRGYVIADLAPGRPPDLRHCPSGVPAVERIDELDVGPYETPVAIAEAIVQRVPKEAIPVVRLTGTPAFPLDADRVQTELDARYEQAFLTDDSSYFTAERLDELADQDTIAGHVVRLGRQRIKGAPDDRERAAADQGLRIALSALGVK